MTLQELASLKADVIRKDNKLMSLYIEMYEGLFGFQPDCAPCTFPIDFKKFKIKVQTLPSDFNNSKIKLNMKTNKIFKLKKKYKNKIFTYVKDGTNRPVRTYGYLMTDEFYEGFMNNGKKKDLNERGKFFEDVKLKNKQVKEIVSSGVSEQLSDKKSEYKKIVGKNAFHAWDIERIDLEIEKFNAKQ